MHTTVQKTSNKSSSPSFKANESKNNPSNHDSFIHKTTSNHPSSSKFTSKQKSENKSQIQKDKELAINTIIPRATKTHKTSSKWQYSQRNKTNKKLQKLQQKLQNPQKPQRGNQIPKEIRTIYDQKGMIKTSYRKLYDTIYGELESKSRAHSENKQVLQLSDRKKFIKKYLRDNEDTLKNQEKVQQKEEFPYPNFKKELLMEEIKILKEEDKLETQRQLQQYTKTKLKLKLRETEKEIKSFREFEQVDKLSKGKLSERVVLDTGYDIDLSQTNRGTNKALNSRIDDTRENEDKKMHQINQPHSKSIRRNQQKSGEQNINSVRKTIFELDDTKKVKLQPSFLDFLENRKRKLKEIFIRLKHPQEIQQENENFPEKREKIIHYSPSHEKKISKSHEKSLRRNIKSEMSEYNQKNKRNSHMNVGQRIKEPYENSSYRQINSFRGTTNLKVINQNPGTKKEEVEGKKCFQARLKNEGQSSQSVGRNQFLSKRMRKIDDNHGGLSRNSVLLKNSLYLMKKKKNEQLPQRRCHTLQHQEIDTPVIKSRKVVKPKKSQEYIKNLTKVKSNVLSKIRDGSTNEKQLINISDIFCLSNRYAATQDRDKQWIRCEAVRGKFLELNIKKVKNVI